MLKWRSFFWKTKKFYILIQSYFILHHLLLHTHLYHYHYLSALYYHFSIIINDLRLVCQLSVAFSHCSNAFFFPSSIVLLPDGLVRSFDLTLLSYIHEKSASMIFVRSPSYIAHSILYGSRLDNCRPYGLIGVTSLI